MNFLNVQKGKWVRVIDTWNPALPYGTEILKTSVLGQVYGVTRDGDLLLLSNPSGLPLEVEEISHLTFGDLSPGDKFLSGDDILWKLNINKGLVNDAGWDADGIAVDVSSHTPYNFSNDDEVERA